MRVVAFARGWGSGVVFLGSAGGDGVGIGGGGGVPPAGAGSLGILWLVDRHPTALQPFPLVGDGF